MKRALAVLTIVFASVAAGATAGVFHGDDENEYEGRVDRSDDSYFGFDLNNAKTRVKGITAVLAYACDDDELVYTLVEADGSLPLNGEKEFAGTVSYEDNDDGKVTYGVKGKLKSGGRASGTVKGQFRAPGFDGPCLSGLEEWQVLKGRDVDSPL